MRLAVAILLAMASAVLLSGSSEEKRLSIYSTVANYSLPVVERNQLDYVGLLEASRTFGHGERPGKWGPLAAPLQRCRCGVHRESSAGRECGKRISICRQISFWKAAGDWCRCRPEQPVLAHSRRPGDLQPQFTTVVCRQCCRPLHGAGQQHRAAEADHELQCAGEPDHRHRAGKAADDVQSRSRGRAQFPETYV